MLSLPHAAERLILSEPSQMTVTLIFPCGMMTLSSCCSSVALSGSVFAPFSPFSCSVGGFVALSSFEAFSSSSAFFCDVSCSLSPVASSLTSSLTVVISLSVSASTVPVLFPSASYVLTLPSGFVCNAPSGTSSVSEPMTFPVSSQTTRLSSFAAALNAASSFLYSLQSSFLNSVPLPK